MLSRVESMAARSIGRRAAESMQRSASQPRQVRMFATVKKVNGDGTLDIDVGDGATPMPMLGVRMTTACSGVAAGKRVIVDTVQYSAIVTGVLA